MEEALTNRHRYYAKRNHVKLPKSARTKTKLLDSGTYASDMKRLFDLMLSNSEQGFIGLSSKEAMWKDVARTQPVTAAGDAVASWRLQTRSGMIYATQATAGNRPLYGEHPSIGIRNLANGSADVGNTAYWVASTTNNGVTATKVASGVDTDGVPYADYTIVGTASALSLLAVYVNANSRITASVGQQFTTSFTARVIAGTPPIAGSGARPEVVGETSGLAVNETFAAVATNATVDTAISITGTLAVAGSVIARCAAMVRTQSGQTVNYTIRIKALQFELGSARTNYQFNYSLARIVEAPYAARGCLVFDGATSNRWLQTEAIDFSASDEVTVVAGVRKLSDAARGFVFAQDNLGLQRIALEAPSSVLNDYQFTSGGSSNVAVRMAVAAPNTSVVAMQAKIASPSLIVRRNGSQVNQSIATQGTGNFSNQPFYIGRFGGTTLPFFGYLYGLACRSKLTSAASLAEIESIYNQWAGAY